jgi:hypothetical protein
MRLRGRKSVVAALVVPTIYWRIAATAAAQTNIAPDGTGYVWPTMTTAIATTGQTAAPGINNGNLTTAGQRNRMEHGLSHSPTGCMSQYNLAPHAGPQSVAHWNYGVRFMVRRSNWASRNLQLPAHSNPDHEPLQGDDREAADWERENDVRNGSVRTR